MTTNLKSTLSRYCKPSKTPEFSFLKIIELQYCWKGNQLEQTVEKSFPAAFVILVITTPNRLKVHSHVTYYNTARCIPYDGVFSELDRLDWYNLILVHCFTLWSINNTEIKILYYQFYSTCSMRCSSSRSLDRNSSVQDTALRLASDDITLFCSSAFDTILANMHRYFHMEIIMVKILAKGSNTGFLKFFLHVDVYFWLSSRI